MTNRFLGMERRFGGGLLAGAALSFSESTGNFGLDASEAMASRLSSAYQYLRFTPGQATEVWSLVGAGKGTAAFTDAQGAVTTELSMEMLAFGSRHAFREATVWGWVPAVSADGFLVRLSTPHTGGLRALGGQASRLRAGVTLARPREGDGWSPQVGIGLRHEDDERGTVTRTEVAGGARLGLSAPDGGRHGALVAVGEARDGQRGNDGPGSGPRVLGRAPDGALGGPAGQPGLHRGVGRADRAGPGCAGVGRTRPSPRRPQLCGSGCARAMASPWAGRAGRLPGRYGSRTARTPCARACATSGALSGSTSTANTSGGWPSAPATASASTSPCSSDGAFALCCHARLDRASSVVAFSCVREEKDTGFPIGVGNDG